MDKPEPIETNDPKEVADILRKKMDVQKERPPNPYLSAYVKAHNAHQEEMADEMGQERNKYEELREIANKFRMRGNEKMAVAYEKEAQAYVESLNTPEEETKREERLRRRYLDEVNRESEDRGLDSLVDALSERVADRVLEKIEEKFKIERKPDIGLQKPSEGGSQSSG